MLKLGTIVTVVLISLLPSQHGLQLQNKEILNILKFLKERDDIERKQQEVESIRPNYASEENNSVAGLLKKMEVIDLIEKADKGGSKAKYGEIKSMRDELLKDEYGDYDLYMDPENYVIEDLVHGNAANYQKKKQLITPNNLLNTLASDKRDPMDPLNEYSKVYIVLDPKTVEKSQNQEALSQILSRILSLTSSRTQIAREKKKERNPNSRFKVKSNYLARRNRRDSREGYGGGDDDEYRPKRGRYDRGGGGGNGGRTGIPYMKPRGDIYEKY